MKLPGTRVIGSAVRSLSSNDSSTASWSSKLRSDSRSSSERLSGFLIAGRESRRARTRLMRVGFVAQLQATRPRPWTVSHEASAKAHEAWGKTREAWGKIR